jgi:hypothetical protein
MTDRLAGSDQGMEGNLTEVGKEFVIQTEEPCPLELSG